ncbi:hypothetical protein M3A49_31055 [Paraburkholderia sp. CNPSo 3076]|uniref:hypothetical protein n=1 Tax=Paraburkholderia sp. CNPSo 3076 TaxID=2940936 RepID=UPI00225746C0|nr:hypothetical protein [Paraburkholderia sp. CNPSo 3076]MCX5543871.1 hypothetical protein [Paraburkholderia sp. CNPSo 3076]
MHLTEARGSDDATGWSVHERIVHHAAGVHITDAARASVLVSVIAQVRSSYRDRDLRTPAYRDHAIAAQHLLHGGRGRHMIPIRFAVAPRAKPRGMVVACPVALGRKQLVDRVMLFIGDEPKVVRVTTTTGFTEYLQLPALRATWPIDGKLPGLAQGIIGAFDAAFHTAYAYSTHTPLFRERDFLPAICALGVASNLGLLVIERINIQDTGTGADDSTWNALAQFTRMTGIPVLCLPTPGAAAVSLSKLPGARADLTAGGLIEIAPARAPYEAHWIAMCNAIFDTTIRLAGIPSMPAWLPDTAYELTLGYPGLLAKVLTAVALHLVALKTPAFSAEVLTKYGMRALRLDQPHIDAIRIIRQGGKFTSSSLIRYGDWLSFDQLVPTHMMPELQ